MRASFLFAGDPGSARRALISQLRASQQVWLSGVNRTIAVEDCSDN